MEFLIVLGFLSFITMTLIKNRLFWEVNYDEPNVEAQEKAVKTNKIFWNLGFYGGLVLMVIGIIGSIAF